jgi:hypothetical protein
MDHIPIHLSGQGRDITTFALREPGQWPWDAVPGRSPWDDEVVEQAEVADELGRDVAAGLEQTGGWVMCLALPCTKMLPDLCPDCGSLEISHGGGRAAYCRGCGRTTEDEAAFEVAPCYVLAANHDSTVWGASVHIIDTRDCLGDTFAAAWPRSRRPAPTRRESPTSGSRSTGRRVACVCADAEACPRSRRPADGSLRLPRHAPAPGPALAAGGRLGSLR